MLFCVFDNVVCQSFLLDENNFYYCDKNANELGKLILLMKTFVPNCGLKYNLKQIFQ